MDRSHFFTFFWYTYLISFFILRNLGTQLLLNTILIGSAFYLFFITIRDLFSKKFKNVAQNLSHLGFSLLILSILFNNIFSREVITNLKVGEKFKNDEFQIVFNDLKKSEEKNYISFKGYFSIKENKNEEKLE